MTKILNIIGARPQIIKASAIIRAIENHFISQIEDIIVHTGQHYDREMSSIFIEELQIPEPQYNLDIGSASHGIQTSEIIKGIEKLILSELPDCILVYGDTNSTLAAAISASKLHCPIVHIEAGLRSFNKLMPEEINRIMCDHASTLLFTPTKTGYNNLINEGFNTNNKPPYSIDNPGVFHCGDVMYDNTLYFSKQDKISILNNNNLTKDNFILVTIHRDNNTDNAERLQAIFKAIDIITKTENIHIIIPLHPRTAKVLKEKLKTKLYNLIINNNMIKIISPVSFFDMIVLEKNAKIIMTDSGGVQKEAFFFKKPCIILRPETEWKELVENGTAVVADANTDKITESYKYFNNKKNLFFPSIFGDGHAAEFICNEIVNAF